MHVIDLDGLGCGGLSEGCSAGEVLGGLYPAGDSTTASELL